MPAVLCVCVLDWLAVLLWPGAPERELAPTARSFWLPTVIVGKLCCALAYEDWHRNAIATAEAPRIRDVGFIKYSPNPTLFENVSQSRLISRFADFQAISSKGEEIATTKNWSILSSAKGFCLVKARESN